ncbi:MAG: hypothetical protein JNK82_36935 [Myxococcaceae bacterium]|nr:hypothetical protein [Myxococcaceae bacterium]
MPPVRAAAKSTSVVKSKPTKTPSAAKKKPTSTAKKKSAVATNRQRDDVSVGAAVGKALKASGKGPYDLVPGRYPGTVSLPDVLGKLGTTPEGQKAVGMLLGALKEKAGITVTPDVQAELLSNPSGATKALELSPRQLSTGIVGLNAAYQAGQVKPIEPRKLFLPREGFDLSKVAELELKRETPKLKEVAPGLFTGSLPSTVSDAQLKQSRVLSEVFDRLGKNASAGAGEKFSVTFKGQAYTRLDALLGALKANGHDVKVTFEQRIANFADLKAAVPGTNPPVYADVPAPLMLRTGVRDAAGREAIVPAAHSEMIVSVTGPELNADSRFYQGTDGTGFFARGGSAEPQWLGRVSHGELEGADAVKAVVLAGALGDVIGTAARAANLYADGYGMTGVCNDSVAVVQQAMMGKADMYPLLMRDDVLFGELKTRLSDADVKDDPTYRELKKAIEALPSDVQTNPTLRARALSSIPWGAGAEPFESTVAARKVLSGG